MKSYTTTLDYIENICPSPDILYKSFRFDSHSLSHTLSFSLLGASSCGACLTGTYSASTGARARPATGTSTW